MNLLLNDAGPLADRRQGSPQAFSAAKVNRVVSALAGGSKSQDQARGRWLSAVARSVVDQRPDLASALLAVLGADPSEHDHLAGLTIGEIGVCYEALLSQLDRDRRKRSGQFFTPDDAARFMAKKVDKFEPGTWLDPCCGVGNLSWHLAAAQEDPADFVRDRLTLIDRDATALLTAVALISAKFAASGDVEAVQSLAARATRRDFLAREPLPPHDYAILNPPYARAVERSGFETGACRDLFAYFIEKVAKESRGFVAVTPASYLSAPKFQPVRALLERYYSGGDVYVFDNVPDTLFRGYKFGSHNTSKTNFVRAAVTVCSPSARSWQITPILRWQVSVRAVMFEECKGLLAERKDGPNGEWAKPGPGVAEIWDELVTAPETLSNLIVSRETPYWLDVALTPRYYISATYRSLDRGSKARLYFPSAETRDRAAVVLNSSLPYLWWRALDGGVTLPRRVLMSVPIPSAATPDSNLVARLKQSEEANLVVKVNAGRDNENVKHPRDLVHALNEVLLPPGVDLSLLYSNSMFPLVG